MCGISGIYAFTPNGLQYQSFIDRATECLKMRGPDDQGIYQDETVAIGHTRLSIIDLSSAGHQPMSTQDGRYTIAYNGELFNYKELALLLSDEEKCKLVSTSDTEVFLFLYAKYKESLFEKLQGFFAAAIYDSIEKSLVLVRDRYGKKPLLIYKDEDKVCFSSEMKGLFAFGIQKKIDWNILPLYFQLNYIPEPHSLIENVTKLSPGNYVKINKAGIKQVTYYKLHIDKRPSKQLSYLESQSKLVNLMDKAVSSRLVADVPVGAFLSGGIDSSVVVALAAKHTKHLNTFSIGYKDHPFFDETFFAGLVAKKYNTEHTTFSLSNDDFLNHIFEILDYLDEPFADSSAIPEYILCMHTRKKVKVALSGDGGDEVFAGYNKHLAEWRMREGSIINQMIKAGSPLWSILPKSRNNRYSNIFRQLDRFAKGVHLSPGQRYWEWATHNNQADSLGLFHNDIKSRINEQKIESIKSSYISDIKGEEFNEVLIADMNLVLLSDMLVKVDLMSMANSLEVRSPFLDSAVVEFGFSISADFKIDDRMKKKIVQDAFRKDLPEEIYNRPKKGFEIPLLDWFKKDLWKLINDDLLNDDFIIAQRIFDLKIIQELKRKLHSKDPGNSTVTIWAIIVFQYWWKKNIESCETLSKVKNLYAD